MQRSNKCATKRNINGKLVLHMHNIQNRMGEQESEMKRQERYMEEKQNCQCYK